MRRAQQAADEAERTFDQADESQAHLKKRLGERMNAALKHLDEVKTSHLLRPLAPTLALDEATLHQLQGLLAELPSLWRHPRITPIQRKMLLRRVIRAIWVYPDPECWRFEIEWQGGERSADAKLPTHEAISDEICRGWADGEMPDDIAAHLTREGIVRRKGLQAGTPYSPAAVRDVVRKRGLQRSFDARALAHMRPQLDAGVRYATIAGELNEAGIRHSLGLWTALRVGHVARRVRRRHAADEQPLRTLPPIDEPVQQLHDLGRTVPEIVASLREERIRNRRRRPVTTEDICRALKRLGLRPRSTVDNERLGQLLRTWTATLTLGEITRRANALGLLTRRSTPWTYDAILAKLKSLGLQAQKKERGRDAAGRFVNT